MMPSDRPAADAGTRRKPWLAATLTGLVPGLGQLYNGRPWRAVVALLAVAGTLVGAVVAVAVADAPFPLYGLAGLAAIAVHLGLVWEAYADARGRPSPAPPWDRVWPYLGAATLGIAVFALVQPALDRSVSAEVVLTHEMTPELLAGDTVLVDRLAYVRTDPRPGDVVVVAVGDGETFRRVVVPGPAEVEISTRSITVDGQRLWRGTAEIEDALTRLRAESSPPVETVHADAGEVALVSDRLDQSPEVEVVDRGAVRGRAVVVLWSLTPDGALRPQRVGVPILRSDGDAGGL